MAGTIIHACSWQKATVVAITWYGILWRFWCARILAKHLWRIDSSGTAFSGAIWSWDDIHWDTMCGVSLQFSYIALYSKLSFHGVKNAPHLSVPIMSVMTPLHINPDFHAMFILCLCVQEVCPLRYHGLFGVVPFVPVFET